MIKLLPPVFRADLARHFFALLCWLSITSGAWAAGAVNQLVVYPVTEGMPQNGDYIVKARTPGQKWRDVPAYLVKVAQGADTSVPAKNTAISQNKPKPPQNAFRTDMGTLDSSMTSLDFSGTIDVSITYTKGDIKSARVRPLSYGITPLVKKNTITFSLAQPRNLSVEVNGDIFHNLQLFANSIEDARPNPADPNVIYYGPGAHQVGRVVVPSGKTVYLAGGALVEGSFLVNHVENVHILGRGILYQSGAELLNRVSSQKTTTQDIAPPRGSGSRRDALLIEFSTNIGVEGIIVV